MFQFDKMVEMKEPKMFPLLSRKEKRFNSERVIGRSLQ